MTRLLRTCRKKLGSFVYGCNGRIPWTDGRGYVAYKDSYIERVIGDEDFLRGLDAGREIPEDFGMRLDERVIEYPWVLAKLSRYGSRCRFLDAGSTLNHQMILEHALARRHKWTLLTLAPERNCFWDEGVSYVFDDLRSMPFRDRLFDAVFCISVIEHVGMDNFSYTADGSYREDEPDAYLSAVTEMKRTLSPGGWLYLTVPFGCYEDHGWLQQFNAPMLSKLIAHFAPQQVRKVFFRYDDRGWKLSTEDQCSNSRYIGKFFRGWDSKQSQPGSADVASAVAASAVACIELQK